MPDRDQHGDCRAMPSKGANKFPYQPLCTRGHTLCRLFNRANSESARRWAMDDAGQELRQHPVQHPQPINTANVKQLKLAWTFSTGLTRGQEAAPLVVNNTMYIVTPWPNLLYALDLTKPGAPGKWTYTPGTVGQFARRRMLRCGKPRGGLFYNGKIYYNTLDMHTVAVDAKPAKKSGRQHWAISIWANR